MNQNDDIERLFSWLQTREIRYREFAGAREITDAVGISLTRANTPQVTPAAPHNAQLDEEYPPDQYPDQSAVVAKVEPVVRAPAAEPAPAAPATPEGHPARPLDSVFDRLAGDRATPPDPRDRLRHIPRLGPTSDRSR
jgi:hypothetical protein